MTDPDDEESLTRAPSGALATELSEVKSSAERLRARLKEANRLPKDFPKDELDFLAGTLTETPGMSAEGALHALIYGRDKLSEIRGAAIRVAGDDPDEQNNAVERGDMIDMALALLVTDIGTALNRYGGSRVSDAEGAPGEDRVPGAPPDADYAAIAEQAEALAVWADAVAGKIEPSAPELESVERGMRDVATLERQTGLETRTTRHPGRMERLGNGLRVVAHGAVVALRAVRLACDAGKIAVEEISNALTGQVTEIIDAVNRGAERLEHKIAERRSEWEGEPNGKLKPAFKPFSIFQDRLDDGSEGPEMVVLPSDEFWMGSTPEEQERFELDEFDRKWESPRHLVRIDRPFAMGRYPVTFEEYGVYCDVADIEMPDDENWGRGRRPVINVSHDEATNYCDWLSDRTGAEYRLPSEAEWEYACRAGTDTAYWWGDDWDEKRANGASDIGKTTEVGIYDPNPWNLCDVHGNVWEWCADHWLESYDLPRSQTPINATEGSSLRVQRGGSWDDHPWDLRSASRDGYRPGLRYRSIGFRLARTLTP